MTINRKFYYIRPTPAIKYYHSEFNPDYQQDMNEAVKKIDPSLSFFGGTLNERVDFFVLSQLNNDPELFKEVTHNLYYEGTIKQHFKECMRFTKQYDLAFALATNRTGRSHISHYDMWDGFAVKPLEKKLIDATPHQKQALKVYDLNVVHPNFYFTINFFDYKHNLKYVQMRFVGMRKEDYAALDQQISKTFPTFEQEKKNYNTTHGIEQEDFFERNVATNINQFTTTRVNKYLPADLQNFSLPIEI